MYVLFVLGLSAIREKNSLTIADCLLVHADHQLVIASLYLGFIIVERPQKHERVDLLRSIAFIPKVFHPAEQIHGRVSA